MLIFARHTTVPLVTWIAVAAGWAFIPKRNLNLLVNGIVYDIPYEAFGIEVSVQVNANKVLIATYVV